MSEGDTLSDAEVIRLVRAGDRNAFRSLVMRHQRKIYSLIARQVQDPEIASELTQDAFVRAFRHLNRFEARSSFETWLYCIALNVTRSYFSSRRYKEALKTTTLPEELGEPPGEAPAGAATEGESAVMMKFLETAIAGLKPIYREPLILCRFERKTYQEAGIILGIPEGTVCSRLNTAVIQLRKQFAKYRI